MPHSHSHRRRKQPRRFEVPVSNYIIIMILLKESLMAMESVTQDG
jgi:hypothetical protein